jgi:hypothetical protein
VGDDMGEAVGEAVGDSLGRRWTGAVGESLGDRGGVGETVLGDDEDVGDDVGEEVGDDVGEMVGEAVGEAVGDVVGKSVGDDVGEAEGEAVGDETWAWVCQCVKKGGSEGGHSSSSLRLKDLHERHAAAGREKRTCGGRGRPSGLRFNGGLSAIVSLARAGLGAHASRHSLRALAPFDHTQADGMGTWPCHLRGCRQGGVGRGRRNRRAPTALSRMSDVGGVYLRSSLPCG